MEGGAAKKEGGEEEKKQGGGVADNAYGVCVVRLYIFSVTHGGWGGGGGYLENPEELM